MIRIVVRFDDSIDDKFSIREAIRSIVTFAPDTIEVDGPASVIDLAKLFTPGGMSRFLNVDENSSPLKNRLNSIFGEKAAVESKNKIIAVTDDVPDLTIKLGAAITALPKEREVCVWSTLKYKAKRDGLHVPLLNNETLFVSKNDPSYCWREILFDSMFSDLFEV